MALLLVLFLFSSANISTLTLIVEEEPAAAQAEITPQYIADKIIESRGLLPNNPDSAIQIVEGLLLYKWVTQNDSLYARAKYVAGVAYYYKDFYNISIESYKQALSTRYAQSDEAFRVRLLNNIGVSYDNLKQHDDALHYYHRALEIEKRRGALGSQADMYINIGLVYFAIDDFKEALKNFKLAQHLIEGLPVDYTNGLIQQNLGIVYKKWK
ncbi:MAG TPA: tetratricopeptide repeat protein [Balneolaceae bacterium]|nr:tetratricopeptide repeat protein [Balneolaceae bacterium]